MSKRIRKQIAKVDIEGDTQHCYFGSENEIEDFKKEDIAYAAKRALNGEPVKDMDKWFDACKSMLKDDGKICLIGN